MIAKMIFDLCQDLASFPVGSHLHLVTFANKALFVDETDGRKSVFGLRGKAQSAGEVPFSVEYRWGNAVSKG